MAIIKGIPVVLYEKTQTGVDDFNAPIYTEVAVTVENVLVGQPTSSEIVDATNLYGKKAIYTLGIPKGDTHNWEDKKVEFFGHTWHTFGFAIKGIDHLVPLDWNAKIMVERYD